MVSNRVKDSKRKVVTERYQVFMVQVCEFGSFFSVRVAQLCQFRVIITAIAFVIDC